MSQFSDSEPDRDGEAALSTAFERSTRNARGYRDVSPAVVHDTLGSARIIDVREPHEYVGDLGHIADSALVPLSDLEEEAAAWDRHAPVVLVDRSGGRAALGAVSLVRMGFGAVMSMTGGMLAWNDAALPVVHRSPDLGPSELVDRAR